MNIYIIGICGILLLYVFVGTYAGKKVKNVDDYYVAGRNAPTILILGTLIASALSTVAFMGDAGFAYDGFFGLDLGLTAINCGGFILGALFFGRYLRRSKALTSAEYFQKRFHSRGVQKLIAIVTIVALTGYLVSVTQGAAILMETLTGFSYLTCLFIVWIAYASFTFYSGSEGVLITDTMMFILFTIIAVVAAPLIIGSAGGWPNVMETLTNFAAKPGVISLTGLKGPGGYASDFEAIAFMVAVGCVWGFCFAVSPWQAGRYLMAKDEHTVIRVGSIAGIFQMLVMIGICMMAVSINVIKDDIAPSEQVLVWAAMNLLPTALGILLLSGILSAALSSCSTFLSIVGFTLTRDILNINETTAESSKKALKYSRATMVVVGLVALAITYFQTPAVMMIGIFAGTLIAASMTTVSFASVWSRRLTKTGAFWGILMGFAGSLVVNILKSVIGVSIPSYFGPFYIGTACSIMGVIVGSAYTQVSPEEKEYREMLHVEPEGYRDLAAIKRTMLYPKVAILVGAAIVLFFIFSYSIPYNQHIIR